MKSRRQRQLLLDQIRGRDRWRLALVRVAFFAVVALLAWLLWVLYDQSPGPGTPITIPGNGPAGPTETREEVAATTRAPVREETPPETGAEDPPRVLRRENVPPAAPQRKKNGRWDHALLGVVDYATGSPLAGVTVFDALRGKPLGVTDRDGAIALGDALLPALALAREGWLVSGLEAAGDELRNAEAALAKGEPAKLVLVDDRFTLPLRLLFKDSSGKIAEGVRFSVRKLEPPIASSLEIPRARLLAGERLPPQLLRAWEVHVRYTRLRRFTRALHHYGIESENEVFEAADGRAELRMPAAGSYRVVAVAQSGERTGQNVQVHAVEAPEVAVRLGLGLALSGRVLAADDRRPVEGATVTVSPLQILLVPRVTGADGRFAFAGLLADPVQLDVRAPGFEGVAAGPYVPGGQMLEVLLPRKKTVTLAGTVVEQGTNRPVADASVSAGGGLAERTDASGAFRLPVPGSESFVLSITAAGFEPYSESVDPEAGAPPSVFSLVPAEREAQLRARLVSRIQGRVLDHAGKPVAGAIVDLHSAVPWMAQGLPGRAIISGGFPADEARTQTDGDGRFTLFTRQEGSLVLTVRDEGESREQEVALVKGTDRQGLELKIVGKR